MNHGCTVPINQTISEIQSVSINLLILKCSPSLSEKAGESEAIAARCRDL